MRVCLSKSDSVKSIVDRYCHRHKVDRSKVHGRKVDGSQGPRGPPHGLSDFQGLQNGNNLCPTANPNR